MGRLQAVAAGRTGERRCDLHCPAFRDSVGGAALPLLWGRFVVTVEVWRWELAVPSRCGVVQRS